MKVAAGADHAGFELKRELLLWVEELGHEALDLGTHDTQECDYPDSAAAVAECILQHHAERGVLICGSGVGASVAANKFPGIRAAVCHDVYSARQGVTHDDLNILVLGARVIGRALAKELLKAFLEGQFSGEPRHVRRLAKIEALEIGQRSMPQEL